MSNLIQCNKYGVEYNFSLFKIGRGVDQNKQSQIFHCPQ